MTHFNSNDSSVTLTSPNQTTETLPRDYRTGTISRLFRNLTLLFAVLVMSVANVGMAWGDTYADVYTNPASGSSLAGNANGKGAFSVITPSGNVSFGNNSLQINTSGASGTFTVASIDGSYITSIAFTNSSSYPINTLTSDQGTITKDGDVYTFTPSSATLTSATFSMSAQSGKKVRVAPITVNLTSNHSYLSMNFGVSSGTVSCTKSAGASDLVVTTTGSASSNRLSFGSGKTLTFTSEDHNIAAIHFTFVNHADGSGITASTGTFSGSSWTPDENVKTVTFSSSGSNTIGAISVELVEIGETHTVTAATNNASYGTAAAASSTVAEGSTTTITATPNSGYAFDHWTVSGTGATLSSTSTNPTTLTMGTADATVTAYFAESCDVQVFSLTDEIGSAVVTASDATVTAGTSLVMSNTSGRIRLTPASGKFKNGDKVEFGGTIGNTSKNYGIKIYASDGTTSAGNIYVAGTTSPLKASGTLSLASDQDYIFIARYDGTTTTLTSCEITRVSPCPEPPSCTAPNHVDISGRWDRFGGETISLTATAYSSEGTGSPIADGDITGWQWEKLIGTTWTPLSNGTAAGVTTSGATTKNLQIANCGAGNSGKYRCVVSTGATCSTPSATATDGTEGFGVKVYVLECYNDGTKTCSFTRTGDTQAGTATLTLAANTAYTFKVHADNTYYGNSGTIDKDETNWVMCNSDNGASCGNLTVNSGLGGTFTFGIEYSISGNSSVEGEPELSVTYPRKTMYLVPNSDWTSNSAKFAFYYYGNSGTGWTDFLTSNDCGMSAEIPQWNGLTVIAVRFNPSDATPGWNGDGHVWNQTGDITATADKNCVTITDWNTGTYGTYSIPTYTISYNAGTGGSGSKANETKTCGVAFTLPGSTFTYAGHTQDGWSTSDGGSKVYELGASYTTDAPVTLYPHWVEDDPTIRIPETTILNYANQSTSVPTTDDWDVTDDGNNDVCLDMAAVGRTAEWNVYIVPGSYNISTICAVPYWGISYRLSIVDPSTDSQVMELFYEHTGGSSGTPIIRNLSNTFDLSGLVAEKRYIIRVQETWNDGACSLLVHDIVFTPLGSNHDITFAKGNASVTGSLPANTSCAQGGNYTLPGKGDLAWTGHTFAGWNDGTSTYAAGASYTMPNNDVTFTAQWTPFVVPTVTNLEIDPSSTSTSVVLNWNIPGICDLSKPVTPLVQQTGTTTSAAYSSVNDDVTVVGTMPQYEQFGVGFTIPATTGIEWISYDFKGSLGSGDHIWGGASDGTYVYWQFADPMSDSKIPTSSWQNSGHDVVNRGYWDATDFVTNPLTQSCTQIAIYGNTAISGGSSGTFNVRNVRYHTAGMIDIDHVVLMRKEGSAASSPSDGAATQLYSGKASHYTDSPVSASTTYYYTIFAVHADGTLSAGVTVMREAVCTDPVEEATVTAKTHNSATITLTEEARANGYSIKLTSASGAGTFDWKDDDLNTYILEGLTPSTEYTFHVKAYNAGRSCLSAEYTISFTTNAAPAYTVTYNYNGATSGASPANATGASVMLPTPTRTGYELQGWYTTAGTKAGDGGDTYNPTANITLYAKWYETCAPDGSSAIYNTDVLASPTSPATATSTSGTFYTSATSWSSSYSNYMTTTGSSGYYQLNFATPLSLTGYTDVKLKVYWGAGANRPLKLSINSGSTTKIDEVSGTGEQSKLRSIEKEITVSSISSIKLISDGGGQVYLFRIEISGTATTGGTCYHVTYDGNGATSGFVNDTTAYKSGDEVTVLGNGGRYPYVNGVLAIKGWADSDAKADEGTVDYAPGATFTITADKTLYAVWSDEYPITYHLNGASWADGYSATDSYSYGMGEVTLPIASEMSNPGYTFNGWYANSDLSTGGVVTAIGTSEFGAKEFWAKWTENTYTVTYNANGGTGSMETTVGRYVYLRENTFTYAGHIFMGWNTAANGSGISYNDEDEVELTADMTLYAQWGTTLDATWSITKIDGKLYRGGGGYSVTVYLNQADWDASGDVNDLELTAMEGVVLSNITKTVNGEGKAQVTANFGITTAVAADATEITFTLSVPAAGTYASVELPHNETLDDCGGGGSTDPYVIGYSNSNATNISSSAANRAYQTASNWLSTGNTEFTEKTSTDGFTISANTANYYWQNDGSFTTSSSSNCRIKTIKMGNANNPTIQWTNEDLVFSKVRFIGRNTSDKEATTLTVSNGTTSRTFTFDAGSGGVQTKEVTMDFVSGNTKGIAVTEGTKEINVLIELIPASGGITPTLSWETDLSGGVSKKTSDDDFVHTASQDMNSLGAITYSSNNTAVATVNATTGEVHLEGEGTATITATIAASGCYNAASISYTVTIEDDCDDEAGTITTEDLDCSGIKMTITGHTAADGVTYQWYKVGSPDETVGTNQDNYTTTTAGSYYVIVTNSGERHCAKRSRNTVTVEAKGVATATKIVDSWYVKNGRRTPDVELVQTTNANGFIVKIAETETKIWDSDGSVTTGFGGCGFHLGDNGIIYLNGMKDNGDAPNGLTGDADVTLKITAEGCGGNASELSITIHCQAATERKSIAFVVDGTDGGTFAEANAAHSTESALFKFLDYGADESGAFDLTAQNIYSTTNEKAIREHFSQFDAILITDDPSTKTKGYVNAFGTMIDVRPILSMEAYVSNLSNWGSKGVAGNPSSPNPRQYEMRLQCKDHEIYSGLPAPAAGTHVWSETIDGEEYRHVIMVDSTKSPYAGVAYNEQTAGDKKPALQGFESEDMGNLLGLGLILNGTLHAGVERQEEPAARMMLLGIQNQALPNALTEEGKKVIENALKYLLKTNMEEVDDCSNFFKGGDPTKPRDWNTLANWSKATFPNYETKVRILAPCEVSGIHVRVAQIDIATSGTSSKIPSGTCSGSLTIKEDGALIVGGKVRTAVAPRFAVNELKPTTASDLKVCSSSSGTGALIFDNSDGKTQATVEMWNPSHWETVEGKKKKYWSYVGVPIANVEIPNYFYLGFTYLYDETSGWVKKWDGDVLQPFEGIGLSMQSGNKETFYGTLASTATKEITLTKTAEGGNGENLIGNSWTAPIQIANFENADFGEATATVYVYNTGRDEQASGETGEASYGENNSATAGQWVSVPVNVAKEGGYTGLKVIPAMNAFQVNTASETTLTLDYDKLVRKNAASNEGINSPMRAPRRTAAKEIDALMRVRVSGEKTHTDVWLLQDERFSEDFDNGWEAIYAECDNRSAQLYAVSELGQMAFIAKPDLDGTPLGFAPSRDGNTYSFSFQYTGNEALYLNDMQEETSTLINEENTYMFTYSESDMAGRFIISAQPFGIPAIITGNENINTDAKPIKFIRENKMYILVNGVLYDATGKIVVR